MSVQTFETNVVEIAGERVVRRPMGTFTGEKETSIPEKFEQTVQVEGLTVWRSNGEVPFSDMLLDFVSYGKITFEQAEFSALQRKKDTESSLATLFRGPKGDLFLGEGALGYREERLAKIAKNEEFSSQITTLMPINS
tara:strand:+ start:14563 stop:14976 length:414 start_codon:yes stop_codon:yes gene_type:complete